MSELTVAPGEREGQAPRKKEQREGLAPRKRVASKPARRAVGAALVTMAWHNLWRVRRRTWLTASGVGFAVFLVVFTRSIQIGSLATMVEMGTGQLTGHVQVQHPDYLEDPRMRHTVGGLAAVTETLAGRPGLRAVAPRGTAFALVSAESETGERSFGAQVLGIDPAVEFATLSKRALPGGRPLERTGEALMGSTFVMTVFERTAEFGMLKAIGMTPAAIFRMVQFEGLWMSLLGVALGLVVAFATVSALAIEGISISAFGDFDQMLDRLSMPDALIPVFDAAGALVMTATMVVGVQLAAAVPARRIWRMNAVEALRGEE